MLNVQVLFLRETEALSVLGVNLRHRSLRNRRSAVTSGAVTASRKGGSTSGVFADFIVGKDKSMVKLLFVGVLDLERTINTLLPMRERIPDTCYGSENQTKKIVLARMGIEFVERSDALTIELPRPYT